MIKHSLEEMLNPVDVFAALQKNVDDPLANVRRKSRTLTADDYRQMENRGRRIMRGETDEENRGRKVMRGETPEVQRGREVIQAAQSGKRGERNFPPAKQVVK
jgi:hypothetical protein